MGIVNQILNACRPLISFTALLFGVIAAYKGLTSLVPVLAQIVPVNVKGGSAQEMAVIAAALALVGGSR
jgi:hypothetical protein